MGEFIQVFINTFLAVGQIAIVVMTAGVLVRTKVIKDEYIKGLSVTVVNVFLPCLIFSNLVKSLQPGVHTVWWQVPLMAISVALVGVAISYLAYCRKFKEEKNFIALATFQNAGYLILPIGKVLVPEQFDLFALYVFLFILGYNPLLWSLGNYFTTSTSHTKFSLKRLITVPIVANILGLFFVFTGLRAYIPGVVQNSVELMGSATVPVATFILGASLGTTQFGRKMIELAVLKAIFIKLFIIPAIVIFVISQTSLPETYPVLALVLVLQGASAPATAVILQIKTFGGNIERAQNTLMGAYLICMLSIPFWVSVWRNVQ